MTFESLECILSVNDSLSLANLCMDCYMDQFIYLNIYTHVYTYIYNYIVTHL